MKALLRRWQAQRYATRIGIRYLRSKKRRTVSVITFIAVAGVALGVASLLAVMSITSGFQQEFRNKVLGVNAHVIVLKYGLDFNEYREVIESATAMDEVIGAAPFVINEMMLSHGDRISGVLVKGVDPERMPSVLDLPSQLIAGSLENLRREGAAPPLLPGDLSQAGGGLGDLDEILRDLADELPDPNRVTNWQARSPEGDGATATDEASLNEGDDDPIVDLPQVHVPTPEQAQQSLREELDQNGTALPADEDEDALFDALMAEEEGERSSEENLPGVVVGASLAESLDLNVGDRVKVISPLAGFDTSLFGQSSQAPRSRDFRVTGIFQAGFQEYDSRLVYCDLYEVQHFFDHGDSVTGVEIRLNDLENAPAIARQLESRLGGGPYHTMDWQELNRNLFTALEVQKIMLSLVIASIIFVAAFNVIATLIMIVLEKKREIAILKAMGARNSSMLWIFQIQGMLIGVIGTVIGLLVGGGLCLYLERLRFPLDPNVYLIDHLPVVVNAGDFFYTVLITLLICAGATLVPSWWAARMLPADGVRHE